MSGGCFFRFLNENEHFEWTNAQDLKTLIIQWYTERFYIKTRVYGKIDKCQILFRQIQSPRINAGRVKSNMRFFVVRNNKLVSNRVYFWISDKYIVFKYQNTRPYCKRKLWHIYLKYIHIDIRTLKFNLTKNKILWLYNYEIVNVLEESR